MVVGQSRVRIETLDQFTLRLEYLRTRREGAGMAWHDTVLRGMRRNEMRRDETRTDWDVVWVERDAVS